MTKLRHRRWTIGGALVGALVAIAMGLALNLFLAVVDPGSRFASMGLGQIVLRTALVWGSGGAILGAILGIYASLMWKPK